MPSIRITAFGGLMPEVQAKLINKVNAQVAHNCLLWDGTLRPMPEFLPTFTYANTIQGICTNYIGAVVVDDALRQPVLNATPPITVGTVGVYVSTFSNGRKLAIRLPSDGVERPLSIDAPVLDSVLISAPYPMYRSDCAKKVSYAVTGVRDAGSTLANTDESAPIVIGDIGADGTFFAGDAVTFTLTANAAWVALNKVDRLNLYCTVSGLETGEQLSNPLDTSWFFLNDIPLDEFGEGVYTDEGSGYRGGLDLLPTREFYTELVVPTFLAALDGGWLAVAGSNGAAQAVQFSERFLWHAFPVKNYFAIPHYINGMVAKFNDVFVGTAAGPAYHMTVGAGEGTFLNVEPAPYAEQHKCVNKSMVATTFGAMYASNSGLVALTPTSMEVLTRELLNSGDVVYRDCANDVDYTIDSIQFAAWWDGTYFGFNNDGIAYLYDVGDTVNGQRQFQQLVTMDTPTSIRCAAVHPAQGLVVAAGSTLYHLPVPGYTAFTEYRAAPKLTYKWKSKKFVMPGRTAFAAMKVVNKCDGNLCVSLYADCTHVMTREVTNSQPFRLPSAAVGVEWEVQIEGTATVSEVHIATSIRELLEE